MATTVSKKSGAVHIEHDFAVLKKHRDYQETASIDQIVKAYQ